MTAEVVRRQGTYFVTFGTEALEMQFSSFRETSESLTAQVAIRSKLPLYPGMLHEKRFNLLSSQTQSQWAKYLEGITPAAKLPWSLLLEEACAVVRRAHMAGDPGVLLKDIPRPAGGSWIVPGLVLARMPTIWFGQGGDGKSLLAMAAAGAIQYGRPELFGGLPINERKRVLWLDWEFDGWENAQRARAMLGEEPEIVYARCYGHISKQVERIQNLIITHDAGYLVIDSAAFAAGGKPEDSESVNELFDALRRFDLGCLILAHETKGSDHEMPFGSVYWWNGARNIWYVAKEQAEQSGDGPVLLDIGLFHKKTNKGKLYPPMGFGVEILNDHEDEMVTCRIERRDVRDIDGLSDRVKLADRVLHLALKQPGSIKDWAEELGQKEDSIRKTVGRLAKARKLIEITGRTGNKLWAAVATTPHHPDTNGTAPGHPPYIRGGLSVPDEKTYVPGQSPTDYIENLPF